MSRFVLLIACVTLFLSVQRADGMKCYVCAAINCGDEFKPERASMEVHCTGSCSKIKVGDVVTRACSIFKTDDECQEDGDNKLCYCNGDLCNGSSNRGASAFIVGVISSALLMLNRL